MSIEVMNAVWRESAATGRARLVLLAIADHQGEIGAWPSISTLARMVNASERSVQRDIQELVELGELEVHVQAAPSRGQYKSNLYWVTLPGVTDLRSGVTEIEPGVTETGTRGDTVGVLNLNKPLLKPNRTNDSNLENAFEEFWKVYPRKAGKEAARKAFVKAFKCDGDEVVAGAARFANDPYLPQDKNFIPHPATWLNAGRWSDDPLPPRERSKEELALIAAEAARKAREASYRATEALLRESAAARVNATPAPKCEHGNTIVSCKICLHRRQN